MHACRQTHGYSSQVRRSHQPCMATLAFSKELIDHHDFNESYRFECRSACSAMNFRHMRDSNI